MPGSDQRPGAPEPPAADAPSSAPEASERGGGTHHPRSAALDVTGHSRINIRNVSIKCGHCHTYQTLASYERRGEWNVYTYECENETCDPTMTRTLVEVPAALDEFANRDPAWRGGKRHAGADAGSGDDG